MSKIDAGRYTCSLVEAATGDSHGPMSAGGHSEESQVVASQSLQLKVKGKALYLFKSSLESSQDCVSVCLSFVYSRIVCQIFALSECSQFDCLLRVKEGFNPALVQPSVGCDELLCALLLKAATITAMSLIMIITSVTANSASFLFSQSPQSLRSSSLTANSSRA